MQVDLTPPICNPPVDLVAGDQAPRFTARRAGVGAEWECSDPESGVPLTFWRPQGDGTALFSKDRWYVGASGVQKTAAAATPMDHAVMYNSCVSAVNGAGALAVNYTCSSGFTFDDTRPLTGAVSDFGGSGKRYITDATEICTQWSEFGEDVSGIERLTWELVEAQLDGEVIKRRNVWLGSGSSAPAVSHAAYCTVTVCGNALRESGWTALAEFGSMSPSRFGGSTISGKDDLAAAGWTTSALEGGSGEWGVGSGEERGVASGEEWLRGWSEGWSENDDSHHTAQDTLQWSLGSTLQGSISMPLAAGSLVDLVVAWGILGPASGDNTDGCKLEITDDSGTREFSAVPGSASSDDMHVTVTSVSTINGEGLLSFREAGGICWTSYVLTGSVPSPPLQAPPLPLFPPPFTTYVDGLQMRELGHSICITLGSRARMEHGRRYFTRVTVLNGAGIAAAGFSRSFATDFTPPESGRVTLLPRFPADFDSQSAFPGSVGGVRLRVRPLGFRDVDSGIASYNVTLLADGVIVAVGWLRLRDGPWWESSDLNIFNGTVLEARVAAHNQAGLIGQDVFSPPVVISLANMVLQPPWVDKTSTEPDGYTKHAYTLAVGMHRAHIPMQGGVRIAYQWKVLEGCGEGREEERDASVIYDQGDISAAKQATGAVGSGGSFFVETPVSFAFSPGVAYCFQLTACALATASFPERCKDATSDPITVDVSAPVAATAVVASTSRSSAITQMPFFGVLICTSLVLCSGPFPLRFAPPSLRFAPLSLPLSVCPVPQL